MPPPPNPIDQAFLSLDEGFGGGDADEREAEAPRLGLDRCRVDDRYPAIFLATSSALSKSGCSAISGQ